MNVEIISNTDLNDIDALKGTIVVVPHNEDAVATFYISLPESQEQFDAAHFIALREGMTFAAAKIDEFIAEFYRLERQEEE